jgi:hypothetical protein
VKADVVALGAGPRGEHLVAKLAAAAAVGKIDQVTLARATCGVEKGKRASVGWRAIERGAAAAEEINENAKGFPAADQTPTSVRVDHCDSKSFFQPNVFFRQIFSTKCFYIDQIFFTNFFSTNFFDQTFLHRPIF